MLSSLQIFPFKLTNNFEVYKKYYLSFKLRLKEINWSNIILPSRFRKAITGNTKKSSGYKLRSKEGKKGGGRSRKLNVKQGQNRQKAE